MNRIVKILMKRDDMSQEEAEELFNEAKEEANSIIENNGSLFEVEDILLDYFGLEPDYIFDLIDI